MSRTIPTNAVRPTKAVRILNAVCPTCGKPIYYSPDRWLHCRVCLSAEAARIARAQEAGRKLEAVGA